MSGHNAGRRRGVGRRTRALTHSTPGVEALTQAHERLSGLLGRLLGRLGHNQHHAERVPEEDRQRIVESLFQDGPGFRYFAWRFSALMWMSVTIAVLGLLADSTAVVIGAMLVAPLMSPILGFAAALVMGWPWKALRQAIVAAVGAAGAIALAAVVSAPNSLAKSAANRRVRRMRSSRSHARLSKRLWRPSSASCQRYSSCTSPG